VIREQPPIAQFIQRRRIDRQQQLGDIPRLRKRVHADVGALQIQQHARQDLRLGGMRQQVLRPAHVAAGVLV
jgi:hypothetical protein